MADEEPVSAGASLPGYSLLPHDAAEALQFDIVPRSDASSFQAGYQGLQERGFQVWLRGDVLLKASPQALQGLTRCTIQLTADESVPSCSVPLHQASHILWTSPDLPTTSSSAAAQAHATHPPSVMPFEFSLPQHLPHCLHLPDIKLEYRLVATLHSTDTSQLPRTKTVSVHVTRYSAPGPPRQLLPASCATNGGFSEEPKVWKRTSPTDIEVTLARTLYRRGDHIPLRIQVAAPHDKLIAKGLRIRSVEAELVRRIETRATQPDEAASNPKARAKDRDTAGGWEPHAHLLSSEDAPRVTPPPSSPLATTSHQTILAYSGKACRFSLTRPLVLHLTLVPPFTSPALPHPSPDHDAPPAGLSPLTAGSAGGGGGCESVSQQTRLSEVAFQVKVYIRLRGPSASAAAEQARASTSPSGSSSAGASGSSNQDVTFESEIYVLPALAGAGAEGQEHAEEEATAEQPQPPASTPWPADEEDFDGYEDFRESREAFEEADGRDLPPTIVFNAEEAGNSADRRVVGGTATGPQEPPPTLQQSQHDLQIFPSGHAGQGGDDEALPPPHPERQGQGDGDGDAQVPSYENEGASTPRPPPAWSERIVFIEGVGEGERRLDFDGHVRDWSAPPPPTLSESSSSLAEPALPPFDGTLTSPPPCFDDQDESSPPPPPRTFAAHHGNTPQAVPASREQQQPRQASGTPVEPPPYMTMMAPAHNDAPSASSSSSLPPLPPAHPDDAGVEHYSWAGAPEASGSSTPLPGASATSIPPHIAASASTSSASPSSSLTPSYPTAAQEKEALALALAMSSGETSTSSTVSDEGRASYEQVEAQQGGAIGTTHAQHPHQQGDGQEADEELPPHYEA